jgi:hypothetical protein
MDGSTQLPKIPKTFEEPLDAEAYYRSYKGFATALRTSLIAYGIGAPLFIVSQPNIWGSISYEAAALVTRLYLLGVALQAAHAMFFKWSQWKLFIHASKLSKSEPKIENWASRVYWLDHVADIGSFTLFAFATWKLVVAVVVGPDCEVAQ